MIVSRRLTLSPACPTLFIGLITRQYDHTPIRTNARALPDHQPDWQMRDVRRLQRLSCSIQIPPRQERGTGNRELEEESLELSASATAFFETALLPITSQN